MTESFSEDTVEDLLNYDLYPYIRLIEEGLLDGIMTLHKRFVNIDPDYPATLSKKVIDIIRNLGFNGVAMTDALIMMGIRENFPWLSQKAWQFQQVLIYFFTGRRITRLILTLLLKAIQGV